MGYVLLVKITSPKPVQLVVRGQDTEIANCIYFDRMYQNRPDGLFQGEEWLRFPMPIEYKGIEIRAYDGNTGTANGIQVGKQLYSKPLNQTFTSFKRDDYDDFFAFALQLGQYGGECKVGTYTSPRGLWKCQIVDAIIDNGPDSPAYGTVIDTPASYDHGTGQFLIVKSAMDDMMFVTNRVFVLMHEFKHFIIGRPADPARGETFEFQCDEFAMKICYGYGFGKFEIEASLLRLFMNCQCPKPCNGPADCNPMCPCRERVERATVLLDALNSLPDLN